MNTTPHRSNVTGLDAQREARKGIVDNHGRTWVLAKPGDTCRTTWWNIAGHRVLCRLKYPEGKDPGEIDADYTDYDPFAEDNVGADDNNKKGAPAEAPQENTTATSDTYDYTPFDKITILETVGPHLTKRFKADGTVEAYDDAASFKVHEVQVDNLVELHSLLTALQAEPNKGVIRGRFVGVEKAEKGHVEATFKRVNANFGDQPLHWMCIEADSYRPRFADPVQQPVEAIQEFICDCLPSTFHDASFRWQLSSSAGQPGKEGILKTHLWFWLATPCTSAQLYTWAKTIGPAVDAAVFRRVQLHYTANPIFEDGAVDPVPVRSGLYQGSSDEVPLVIGEVFPSIAVGAATRFEHGETPR
jgi:hypothetical protein